MLYMLKAANKYNFNIDDTLQQFKQDLEKSVTDLVQVRYSRKLVLDRQANLLLELAKYCLTEVNITADWNF